MMRGVMAVRNDTVMRGEDVQDINQPQAAKDLNSTLVTARKVTAAEKKAKMKTPERLVVGETASAGIR